MPSLHTTLLALLAILSSACTMAPKYERPAQPVPDNWPAYSNEASPMPYPVPALTENTVNNTPQDKSIPNADDTVRSGVGNTITAPATGIPGWKSFFTDPVMQRLVEYALQNNRDLRIAMLNIEKARSIYRIERSQLLPSIEASGSNNNQQIPAALSTTRQEIISRESAVNVGFTSYELDLFGRVRSLKENALESYLATEEAAYSTQISLIAEVAANYLRLVADREQLSLSSATYESNKGSYERVTEMFRLGLASQLDLSQAKGSMQSAKATASQYRTVVLQDENALAFLLGGQIPNDITLPETLAEVQTLPDIPTGLPSDLMERRPDILSAEHRLKGANANIGAARANFFPRIGITANIGTASTDLANLFTAGSSTWLFAPSIVLPIFETGANIARLDSSEADKAIAIATYERTIQNAFREVADTLAQRSTIGERLEAEQALVEATTTSYNLSQNRFKVGLDSFLTVLDAQRSMFIAKQNYISTRLLRETNTLTMYKAMGGGWSDK